MDLMGINYIGPISPIAKSGVCFIIISVNYFTRYLFAKPLPITDLINSIQFFKQCVVQYFSWLCAVYYDNKSYFKRVYLVKLKEKKVKQVWAPISYPSSVSLTEQYV